MPKSGRRQVFENGKQAGMARRARVGMRCWSGGDGRYAYWRPCRRMGVVVCTFPAVHCASISLMV